MPRQESRAQGNTARQCPPVVLKPQFDELAGSQKQIIRRYTVDGISYTAVYQDQKSRNEGNYLYVEFRNSNGEIMRYEYGAGEKKQPASSSREKGISDLYLTPQSPESRAKRQLAGVSMNKNNATSKNGVVELAQENRVGNFLSEWIHNNLSRGQATLRTQIANATTREVHVAIGEAAENLRPEALEFLLNSPKAAAFGQANPDVIVYDSKDRPLPPLLGETPLHRALLAEQKSVEKVPSRLRVVELLLSKGANPNAATGSAQTPLDLILSSSLPNRHRIDLVEKLLRHGADPNYHPQGSRSWPPLNQVLEDSRFSIKEKEELILRLIGRGANPHRKACPNGEDTLNALELAQLKAPSLVPLLERFAPAFHASESEESVTKEGATSSTHR